MNQEDLEQKKKRAERKAFLDSLEPISYEKYESIIRQWMLLADDGIAKLIPATIIANRLSRDPIWLYIIGPSGGGKSEMLTMTLDWHEMYRISTLTPNTFLSGMPGTRDTSLLPQVSGKVLAFLDWTNLLSMGKDDRNEIMGQLRDIYGGRVTKIFGTGKVASWEGKIGVIACTTSVVDFQQQQNAALGERFIHYRMRMPDKKLVAKRAARNGRNQNEMREAMSNAFVAFMKSIVVPDEIPEVPEEVEDEIIQLAYFASMARSGVFREYGNKKEVIYVPASEMPTRLTQQLKTLAVALILVNGGVYKEDDMKIIYKIALDSIPDTNYMVMKEMARGNERTTSDIATSCGYPTVTIRQYLENLALLKVATRIRGSDSEEGGTADRWTLDPEFSDILRRFEDIKKIEDVSVKEELPPLDDSPLL